MSSSTQYNEIGAAYKGMGALPYANIELPTALTAIGNVKGLRVLDLACGTGRWTRHLANLGASSVVGVDISSGMIDVARKDSAADYNNIEYHVGDCLKPLRNADGSLLFPNSFDLVFAGWLLNYAADGQDMQSMYQCVASALKPGGRFVTITPPLDNDWSIPYPEEYKVELKTIGKVNDGQWDEGWRVQLTSFTDPPVSFKNYFLPKKVYRETAERVGFGPLYFHQLVYPDDSKPQFWEMYSKKPHFDMMSTVLERV